MSVRDLSEYTRYSKYAKHLPELGRRETWKEQVNRVFDMHEKHLGSDRLSLISDDFYAAKDAVMRKKVLGSQRALQFGGGETLAKHARIYNCTSSYVDRVRFFSEAIYLLLCGCGTGFSVQKHHVAKLPSLVKSRSTSEVDYVINDSIEGWADALFALIQSYTQDYDNSVIYDSGEEVESFSGKRLKFDYSLIRPKGSPISWGGKAPGPDTFRQSMERIENLLQCAMSSSESKLSPIQAYDIVMHAADAVVSGGVRRSACLTLFSYDDEEMIKAKTGNWFMENPQRGRSNNSAMLLRGEVAREEFYDLMDSVRQFGEPGFAWTDDLEFLSNPCFSGSTPVTCLINGQDVKVPIKDVKAGFTVKSFNHDTGEVEYKKVTASGKTRTNSEVVKSKIKTLQGEVEITHTSDHKFYNYFEDSYKEVGSNDFFLTDMERLKFDPDVEAPSYVSEFVNELVGAKAIKSINTRKAVREALIAKGCDSIRAWFRSMKEEGYGRKSLAKILGVTANDIHLLIFPWLGMSEGYADSKRLKEVRGKLSNLRQSEYGIVRKASQLHGNNSNKVNKELNWGCNGKAYIVINNGVVYHAKSTWEAKALLAYLSNGYEVELEPQLGDKKLDFKVSKDGVTSYFEVKDRYAVGMDRHELVEGYSILGESEISALLEDAEIDFDLDFDRNTFDMDRGMSYSLAVCNSVEFEGYEDVYDITVEDNHNFFANDVLVHNCFEIGMRAYDESGESGWQFCNLCEINGGKSKTPEIFMEQCKVASTIGTIQASYDSFSYLTKATENIVKREALLGVSITGMMDNPAVIFDPEVQKNGAKVVKDANEVIAGKIGINVAARSTCTKPSGTSSCILETASGIHPHHANRYFRRVQANDNETPLQHFKSVNPAAVEKSVWSASGNDEVITFLCEVPKGSKTKNDVGAIELLKHVKLTQDNWVTEGTRSEACVAPWLKHNVSNTINVRPHEWEDVAKFIYDNRFNFAGVSLLPDSGDKDYPQAPFCAVHTPKEIVKMYGDGAPLASGLIVAGLDAYDGNLWAACDNALGMGENLKDSFWNLFNKLIDSNIQSKSLALEEAESYFKDRDVGSTYDEVDMDSPASMLDYYFKSIISLDDAVKMTEVNTPNPPLKARYGDALWAKKLATYAAQLEVYHELEEERSKLLSKKDWVRRVKQFAERYCEGDVRKCTYLLKDTHNWKVWLDLSREYKPVDWSDVHEESHEIDVTTLAGEACAGGACEIGELGLAIKSESSKVS